ncbi:glutathione hydrolase 1 proenzyme-like isoform X2 [Coccinella septempunctata]|uniref:glutathione hydrolase 1 proenzyme-like isoform X2 n=1 Tax=Coccinella septempunctata TaxID=41139 RepID=UPI001D0601E5|nr:glutathione hydrolase 1 proenzyme-like isoform X2 [Coccinella septempunctata]
MSTCCARGKSGATGGSIPGETEPMVRNRNRPRVRTAYIVIGIAVVIVVVLAIIYSFGVFKKTKDARTELSPPNPRKSLPPSASKLHTFTKAAVCADGPPCAEIGKNILNDGGSAIDATIATMICNGIYTMQSMGIGGGFLMTIYSKKENKTYTLNARERAPLKADPEMFRSSPNISKHGPLSIGVPGELMGYYEAHKRFGRLPFSKIVQPSILLCEKGYEMSKHQEMSLQLNDITNDTNLRQWFMTKDGQYKKAGDKVVPKKLCETLKILAERGPLDFYKGTLAQQVAEDIQNIGGILTKEDLSSYTAEWMEPVSIPLRDGDTFYSIRPPGSGVLLGFILSILNNYNFTAKDIETDDNKILTYHRIIEALKYAYAKRTELADMEFVNISSLMNNLTSTEYAKIIHHKISDSSTNNDPKYYGGVTYNKEEHGTAHISVISAEGDAVSVTSSVNIYFGCGYTSNRTGILLNSVMDDFSFPFFKNYFGLPGSPNNGLQPGKRPFSSMSPSIVVDRNNDVKLVIGASGGSKITSSVAEVIIRTLWFGENLKEAVDAPRFYHQLYPMVVQYDYGITQQIIEGLEKIGHKTERMSSATSIICALLKTAQQIVANADYRKGGEVFGLN